jgi:hypothetical protein
MVNNDSGNDDCDYKGDGGDDDNNKIALLRSP